MTIRRMTMIQPSEGLARQVVARWLEFGSVLCHSTWYG